MLCKKRSIKRTHQLPPQPQLHSMAANMAICRNTAWSHFLKHWTRENINLFPAAWTSSKSKKNKKEMSLFGHTETCHDLCAMVTEVTSVLRSVALMCHEMGGLPHSTGGGGSDSYAHGWWAILLKLALGWPLNRSQRRVLRIKHLH